MTTLTDSQSFIAELAKRVRIPANIELAHLACGTMTSIYDRTESDIISESIYSGIDRNPELAVLKGLVEFVERQAFLEGHCSGIANCLTDRSDGFAAYPRYESGANEFARSNALAEAVERFAWATWWDDPTIAFTMRRLDLDLLLDEEEPLADVSKTLPLAEVFEIRPVIDRPDTELIVYFAFEKDGGVISGGACGTSTETKKTRYRALGELLRHALAIRKMRTRRLEPVTFYEKRLAYFATENGARDARRRLAEKGDRAVLLPELKFDSIIEHSLSDLVTVHRCFFEGQPEFVGGSLERLCL